MQHPTEIGRMSDATFAGMMRTIIEAERFGVPLQETAGISCEARGRINAEALSREIDEMMEVAEEDGD